MKINTFKVEEWMNEYEQYCKYDLGNTTVQNLSLDELFAITNTDKKEFLEKITSTHLGYGYITGNPDFKNGIKTLYKNINSEEILTTIGAAGANHLVFYSLIEPEDEVVTFLPTYQQLYSIPESFGAKVKHLFLKQENNYLPDIDELKSLVNSKTKMICINNPNNPTGAVIDKQTMSKIIEIAKSIGAYILCDEVYRDLNQTESPIASITELYEKGISTCSMSKIFSLAGLRLGWLATKDKTVLELCKSHREYNMISCSITDEYIAALALKNADKIINRNKKIIKDSLEILDNWIQNQNHFSYIKPKAGTTALVFYDYETKSNDLCDMLAKKHGVFLTPGYCFELENCFRVGYCTGEKGLKDGLIKISNAFSII